MKIFFLLLFTLTASNLSYALEIEEVEESTGKKEPFISSTESQDQDTQPSPAARLTRTEKSSEVAGRTTQKEFSFIPESKNLADIDFYIPLSLDERRQVQDAVKSTLEDFFGPELAGEVPIIELGGAHPTISKSKASKRDKEDSHKKFYAPFREVNETLRRPSFREDQSNAPLSLWLSQRPQEGGASQERFIPGEGVPHWEITPSVQIKNKYNNDKV